MMGLSVKRTQRALSEEEDSNLDSGESKLDISVAVGRRLSIADGLRNAVGLHKEKRKARYHKSGVKRRRVLEESGRSGESGEGMRSILTDENNSDEMLVTEAMDEESQSSEEEKEEEEDEEKVDRFVFEDTSPMFNFKVKESSGLLETLRKNRSMYVKTFKKVNLDQIAMKIAADVTNGTATARHWKGFAALMSQDKAKITLRTRVIPRAISYLKTACVPRVLDYAMGLLKDVGSEVNLSNTLLATLFASQMEGQSAVCEHIASSLCVDMTRRIERVVEVATEHAKKRANGDDYVIPEKMANVAKMPIITKIHAAGTSGCGKTKIAEFIASMYGASEVKGNLLKLSMGNLSDVTATQSLSGTGPGLSGYGEKQSLAHKLKASLRSHDPATECDLVEHLAYANESALGWIRSESEIAEKLRRANDPKAALLSDYASLHRPLTKADGGEATGAGTTFLRNNTDLFVQDKFDVKIGAPIDIAPASFYARDPETQLPVLQSVSQTVETFKNYYNTSRAETKVAWVKKTKEENKQYRRSPDEEDNDEDSKNAANESPRKDNKGKKRSRSEMEKSVSGSMCIPEIGDYAHIAYPSVIVLIMDELDKAHLSVLPHLMDFMDTGVFQSTCGERFVLPCTTHLVIVITSNFGSAEIETLYNDAIAQDVKNGVRTDDDALRSTYYDKMGELVLSAMARRKYQSHYLARLGQIVPYAPISSSVSKKVCVKLLTTDHSAVNRSSPVFHPLNVLPNHNGFVTQYEKAKTSLFLSQSIATATMSMYCFAVALLGGASAKSEQLKNAAVSDARDKLQTWGSGPKSLAVSNRFVSNIGVMMDDVTAAGAVQLNLLIEILSDFATGVVSCLDSGAVDYGNVSRRYAQLAEMTEHGTAKGRQTNVDEDTLSAFVDMKQIFSAASIVLKARVGSQSKPGVAAAIDSKMLRKDYITMMYRWYRHTAEKTMVVLGANMELVCSSLVNASRFNQLGRSQIAQTVDCVNKMRGGSESMTGPISTDTGLRGIKSAVVEKIVKPSDAVLQDSEIIRPLTSTPTTVAELLGANVVSCAYVFSDGITVPEGAKKYIYDKADVFEFPLEYQQHMFCVNLGSLIHLEPDAYKI